MQVLHIAGTNGKGSTTYYLADILSKKGKTGLFTSPHIFDPTERFKIDGNPISKTLYEEYMRAYKALKNDHIWSLFKIWTNIAMDWFQSENVEYAVLETGLGGSEDPTNDFESNLQIITTIDIDHTEHLGTSVRKIATEKCGIIEWQGRVISQPQLKDAEDIIKRTCERLNCNLTVISDNAVTIHKISMEGIDFSFNQEGLILKNIKLNAIAPIQVIDAATAAFAAYDLGIDADTIKSSLYETYCPGRCEFRENILIDTAHNPDSLKRLAGVIKRFFPKTHISVVTAVMKDKNAKEIAEIIESFGDYIICTQADKKRGLAPKEYASFFSDATADMNPAHALLYARDMAEKKKGIVVVCGSFYLLSELFDSSFLNKSDPIVFL